MSLLLFFNDVGGSIPNATPTILNPPRTVPPGGADPRFVAEAINNIALGRASWVGTVTMVENSDQTRVKDNRVTVNSLVAFVPLTANAASAASPYIASGDLSAGQFIVTHANDANTDKTYRYLVLN